MLLSSRGTGCSLHGSRTGQFVAVPVASFAATDFSKGSYRIESYWASLGLFLISFPGLWSQAAALTFYVFCGLASLALVCSIAVPFGGEKWYWLTALSPLSTVYYFRRGTRQEDFKVKMVTADDDSVTDIVIEGDEEEAERFRKELNLAEKGKVYVKGLLES
ncbi:hypothetical protein WJX73_000391 [Symbiochloris irregularis]|uniref:Uncharacterized protein n=1 Tax=Symbiochloris irregularis TaxID=706552 RepID=A0AAW1PRT0_9CHLO